MKIEEIRALIKSATRGMVNAGQLLAGHSEVWVPHGRGLIKHKRGGCTAVLQDKQKQYTQTKKFKSARKARKWIKSQRHALFIEFTFQPIVPAQRIYFETLLTAERQENEKN